MPIIASLRSIDQLLNRFDELSQRHAQFVEHFEQSFAETDNPLRHVHRPDDEQRKTVERILRAAEENDDGDEEQQPKAGRDFHRSMKITRYLHRPPSYVSNRGPARSSTPTTVSEPLPRTTREIISIEPRLSQAKAQWTNPVHRAPVTQDPPAPRRRYGRSPITVFTIETINRLSKPRVYHRSPITRVPPRSAFSSPSPSKRVVNPVQSQVPAKKARLTVNPPSRPLLHLSSPKTVALKFPLFAPRLSVPTKNVKPSFIASHRVRQPIS